jgi:hypothetical protein
MYGNRIGALLLSYRAATIVSDESWRFVSRIMGFKRLDGSQRVGAGVCEILARIHRRGSHGPRTAAEAAPSNHLCCDNAAFNLRTMSANWSAASQACLNELLRIRSTVVRPASSRTSRIALDLGDSSSCRCETHGRSKGWCAAKITARLLFSFSTA